MTLKNFLVGIYSFLIVLFFRVKWLGRGLNIINGECFIQYQFSDKKNNQKLVTLVTCQVQQYLLIQKESFVFAIRSIK